MEYPIEVSNDGNIILAATADSEKNAETAAKALKAAFPSATVRFKVPVDPASGRGPHRWLFIATQTAEDLTLPVDGHMDSPETAYAAGAASAREALQRSPAPISLVDEASLDPLEMANAKGWNSIWASPENQRRINFRDLSKGEHVSFHKAFTKPDITRNGNS